MADPSIEAVARALADNPQLRTLADGERAALARHMRVVTFPSRAVVIHQGDGGRDLYFVIEGQARVMYGALDLGPVVRGEHFGELELIDARPRTATVRAEEPLTVAALGLDGYRALAAEDPALALRFEHALLGGVVGRLRVTTDQLGILMRGRALPRGDRVRARLAEGEVREVPSGTPIGELLPAEVDGRLVVAGLVDRRPKSLTWPIAADCRVTPLTTDSWEGRRIYQDSLSLLMLEAAYAIDPGLVLSMEHSVGFARLASIHGLGSVHADKLAPTLERLMRELVAEDVPLRKQPWTIEEAIAHFQVAGWHAAAELLRTWRQASVVLASYGTVQAVMMGPLLPRAGMLDGFRLLRDEDGLLVIYGPQGTSPYARPNGHAISLQHDLSGTDLARAALAASRQTHVMTREQQRWMNVLGVASVGEFNRHCVGGRVSELIRVAEGYQEKRVTQIADAIQQRGDVKIVCVAGPSSSGKTTFIKRLKVQLQVAGVTPVPLSLDDYYVDREDTPRDEDGELDFESFDALKVGLLRHHLERLLAGEEVRTAHFDFQEGVSHEAGGPVIQLRKRDLLLVEGIHGLNPRLAETLPASSVFRVFICPLAQLPFDNLTRVHGSDVRLLRRIVRDRHSRGANAAVSIQRWPSVRRGERQHIFPFQPHADEVFDSSLVYELSVLKVYAERYLLEVPQDHASYPTAFRLLKLLDHFVTIYPDHVPPTSILREFLGGSGFSY